MDTLQMKRIINAYMRIVRQIDANSRVLTSQSLLAHPESLLPYNKLLIQDALVKAISVARSKQDRIQLRGLERGLVFLQSFLPDDQAAAQNEELLNDHQYWQQTETQTRIERNKHK